MDDTFGINRELLEASRAEIVSLPCFVARCAPDGVVEYRFGWRGNSCSSRPINVLPGKSVVCAFRCDERGLRSFELLCAVHGRRNTCGITVELFDITEIEPARVFHKEVSAAEFKENSFHTFSFPPFFDSRGRWFAGRISSVDATPENCIAVWCLDVPKNSDTYRILELGQLEDVVSAVDWQHRTLEEQGADTLARAPSPARLRFPYITRAEFALVIPDGCETPETAERLAAQLRNAGAMPHIQSVSRTIEDVESLANLSGIIFINTTFSETLVPLLRAAHVCGIPCINVERTSPSESAKHSHLAANVSGTISIHAIQNNLGATAVEELLMKTFSEFLPKFSIVCVLHGKADEVPFFLEALFRQSYRGEYEIIFVDDASPDNSLAAAERFMKKKRGEVAPQVRFPNVRVLRNEENLGNCPSRNKGIAAATGDIVVIIDADCLINEDFLAAHADEYRDLNVDVVVGFFNLETAGRAPLDALREYELNPERVEQESELQDTSHRASFLNCITRNFSIRRDLINEPLADEAFTYSLDPDSGYGWEDVEMGYRLYKRGLQIRFAPRSFSVHISHRSAVEETTKPARSLRNFRRLLDKHPEFVDVARRWTLETYATICRWYDGKGLEKNDDRRILDERLASRSALVRVPAKQKLRILTYRWHCAHQYELYKLGHEFSLVRFPEPTFTNEWAYGERPLPRNVRFISLDDVRDWEFDLAILHFDENVLASYNCNGIIGPQWGHAFRFFREHISLPQIAICHGTPQFRGQYNPAYPFPDLGQVIEEERARLASYLGDVPVVLNSHQAAAEWGFLRSHVIWHGFDPTEFQQTNYRQGALSLGQPMRNRPVYRGYKVYEQAVARLATPPAELEVSEPHVRYGRASNDYGEVKFENYRRALREYSVYFNPTLRSPMPRSRAEAMMCGLVTVSARNHDVDRFIENEQNGFFSNDPAQLGDYLRFLAEHPEKTRRIGAAGRSLAIDLFNSDRYLREWDDLLGSVSA